MTINKEQLAEAIKTAVCDYIDEYNKNGQDSNDVIRSIIDSRAKLDDFINHLNESNIVKFLNDDEEGNASITKIKQGLSLLKSGLNDAFLAASHIHGTLGH